MTVSRKLIVLLRILCTMLGCLVFLFSSILPFYHEVLAVRNVSFSSSEYYYWSYKSEVSWTIHDNYWFFDYWSNLQYAFGPETSWTLRAMFTTQLLTLALGLISIRFNRRSLFFSPVLLSSVVAVLMTYTGRAFGHPKYHQLLHAISPGYQVGYYLVYPSIVVFLFALVLNEMAKKQQTKKSISV